MYAEYLGSDNCGDRETVKHVNKCLPCLYVTASLALVVETVYYFGSDWWFQKHMNLTSGHISAFMVSP
jgi:hypothetical protein